MGSVLWTVTSRNYVVLEHAFSAIYRDAVRRDDGFLATFDQDEAVDGGIVFG